MKTIRVHIRQRPDRNGWQMFYTDPLTRRRRTKITEAETRKDAVKAAGVWENEVNSDNDLMVPMAWERFRTRFENECVASRSRRTGEAYRCALNQFEKHTGKPPLREITSSVVSQFQSKLRQSGLSEASIASYLRHCRRAFKWAERIGIMRKAPAIEMPRVISSKMSKGRPLTEPEFNRLLVAADAKFPKDKPAAASIKFLLRGLWHSGLRIGEACQLDWTQPPVTLDLDTGRFPRVLWLAAGHKARRDEITPITPDFADVVQVVPTSDRVGRVFQVIVAGRPQSRDRIGRLIAEIGELASIKVGSGFAAAHDLRRSFATRWAPKLRPVTLKTIMRHADIKTTLQYYVDIDADDVGAEIWGNSGTPFGTPNRPSNSRQANSNRRKSRRKSVR